MPTRADLRARARAFRCARTFARTHKRGIWAQAPSRPAWRIPILSQPAFPVLLRARNPRINAPPSLTFRRLALDHRPLHRSSHPSPSSAHPEQISDDAFPLGRLCCRQPGPVCGCAFGELREKDLGCLQGEDCRKGCALAYRTSTHGDLFPLRRRKTSAMNAYLPNVYGLCPSMSALRYADKLFLFRRAVRFPPSPAPTQRPSPVSFFKRLVDPLDLHTDITFPHSHSQLRRKSARSLSSASRAPRQVVMSRRPVVC